MIEEVHTMNMKTIFSVIGIIALLLATGCTTSNPRVISVSGESTLTFDPDQAEVVVGVSVVKPTAQAAQDDVNAAMNKIIDGLRYKGVTEKDLATEQLSVYEEQQWEDGTYVSKGWRATQTLRIKTVDMTKVGSLIDVAVSNGANQVYGLNFGLTPEKEAAYKQQALAEATKNAKTQAETVADAAGAKLGKIQSISLSNSYYQPYVYNFRDSMAVGAATKEAAQVIPSDVNINAYVTIAYEIR